MSPLDILELESAILSLFITTAVDTLTTASDHRKHRHLDPQVVVPTKAPSICDTPSDNNDPWASPPRIEDQKKPYRKIWGYGAQDEYVFTWITWDGRWLCEEPTEEEEKYLRAAWKKSGPPVPVDRVD